MTHIKRCLRDGAILALVLLAATQDAWAVPIYARRYKTSCSTCHVAFPKLTPFGEVFRVVGLQMPAGDEGYVKEEPVNLGAPAWKRIWPHTIWPGEIPGLPPLSIRAHTTLAYEQGSAAKSAFGGPSVNLMFAGTMEESISIFIGVHLFDEGEIGFLNRLYIQFNHLLSRWVPKHTFHLRIGQFIPAVAPFALHRGLMLTPYVVNTYNPSMGSSLAVGHHGGPGFGLEDTQQGIQLHGIVRHRLRYGLGLVNGNGRMPENNSAKDGYVRLVYKAGGMGFDGVGGDEETEGGLNPLDSWMDNSVRFGAFGYLGAADNKGTSGPEDLEFFRVGGDLSIYYSDLNLFGAYLIGRDEVIEGKSVVHEEYKAWFAEADYTIYPWLIGALRYERADPEESESVSQIVPHLTALVRANVKVVVETRLDLEDIKLEHFYCLFDYAF